MTYIAADRFRKDITIDFYLSCKEIQKLAKRFSKEGLGPSCHAQGPRSITA